MFVDCARALRDAAADAGRREAQAWVRDCAAPVLKILVTQPHPEEKYVKHFTSSFGAYLEYSAAAVASAASTGSPSLEGMADGMTLIFNAEAPFYRYFKVRRRVRARLAAPPSRTRARAPSRARLHARGRTSCQPRTRTRIPPPPFFLPRRVPVTCRCRQSRASTTTRLS